eukprot:1639452-Pyramimonas_sp.AAC.1
MLGAANIAPPQRRTGGGACFADLVNKRPLRVDGWLFRDGEGDGACHVGAASSAVPQPPHPFRRVHSLLVGRGRCLGRDTPRWPPLAARLAP